MLSEVLDKVKVMGSSKISSGSSLRIRIFLTLGLALTMFQSIRAKPQLDNPINDDWFKNHFDSNFGSDDWFEKRKRRIGEIVMNSLRILTNKLPGKKPLLNIT